MEQAKSSIIEAFNRMVLSKRSALPSIAQLLKEAGIGRSTLYRHFDDRTSVLTEAMHPPFDILSRAAVEGEANPKLIELMEHFWARRHLAVEILGQPSIKRLARNLGEQIQTKDIRLDRADALRIAHTQLTLLKLWLSSETPSSSDEIARKIARSSFMQIAAFVEDTSTLDSDYAPTAMRMK